MKRIIEMRQKRAELWEKAKKFLDDHRDENGLVSAEDSATYDKMEADIVNLGEQIQRLERQQAIDDELNAPVRDAIRNTPITNPLGNNNAKAGRASDEYNRAFWDRMRGDNSLEIRNALQIGTNTEGGYLVPDEFERTLIEALEEENIFRPLAHVIKTSSGDRKIPIVATKGTASWIDEEGTYQESDDAFGQLSIGAYKLGTMIKISEELLNDSAFDMQSYIAREFARRIGAAEEEAFITGDGTGKPYGILADKVDNKDVGATQGVTAAAADKITGDEIIDLFYSLKAPYRKKAVFIMHDSAIKTIRKLKTTGGGDYIWQPSLVAGTPDTLLGRPVYTSAFMPEVATGNKSVIFGDIGYYWIADREGRTFKRLNELFAANGQIGFQAHERVDGRLVLPEAVKYLVQA